jgi:DNA processing protein
MGAKVAERVEVARQRFGEDQSTFDDLEQQGVECLIKTDPAYPERLLSSSRFPVLYVWGGSDALAARSIGICGSRHASPDALRHARGFGRIAAEQSLIVVSGHARGIDEEAHAGALEGGGQTVAVLPEGMEGFKPRSSLRPLINTDNLIAVSAFPPRMPWRVHNAMERNKLICGLSNGVVVVEAGETGGTINAGRECLTQRKPLWVIEYTNNPSAKGNKLLLGEGALPLQSKTALKTALASISGELALVPGRLL